MNTCKRRMSATQQKDPKSYIQSWIFGSFVFSKFQYFLYSKKVDNKELSKYVARLNFRLLMNDANNYNRVPWVDGVWSVYWKQLVIDKYLFCCPIPHTITTHHRGPWNLQRSTLLTEKRQMYLSNIHCQSQTANWSF